MGRQGPPSGRALTSLEQERLRGIEARLRADDPDLAGIMDADGMSHQPRRSLTVLAALCALGAAATVVIAAFVIDEVAALLFGCSLFFVAMLIWLWDHR